MASAPCRCDPQDSRTVLLACGADGDSSVRWPVALPASPGEDGRAGYRDGSAADGSRAADSHARCSQPAVPASRPSRRGACSATSADGGCARCARSVFRDWERLMAWTGRRLHRREGGSGTARDVPPCQLHADGRRDHHRWRERLGRPGHGQRRSLGRYHRCPSRSRGGPRGDG